MYTKNLDIKYFSIEILLKDRTNIEKKAPSCLNEY